MKTLKMPNGQEYTFAPATFTPEVVELIEILEVPGKVEKSPGKVLRLIRSVVKDCMVRGGSTEEQVEAFLCSIPLGKEMADFINPIREAIGIE